MGPWLHRGGRGGFGDIDPQLDLSFSNGGAFVVSGVRRDPDILTLGAGLTVFKGEGVLGFIDYAAHLSDGSREHTATTGLRIRF